MKRIIIASAAMLCCGADSVDSIKQQVRSNELVCVESGAAIATRIIIERPHWASGKTVPQVVEASVKVWVDLYGSSTTNRITLDAAVDRECPQPETVP